MAPPVLHSPTSSRPSAEGTVLASALIVAAVYAYRKLIEPAAVGRPGEGTGLSKVIGLEPKPADPGQFAVAWGFTFLTLSIVGLAAPEIASGGAVLIAVGDVLANGASVFSDISAQTSSSTARSSSKAKAKGKAAHG